MSTQAHRSISRLFLLSVTALLSACAGGTSSSAPAAPSGSDRASEAEWRALATPRPTPLPGAARVSIGEVQILGTTSWSPPAGVDSPLALQELVAAGLLRRQDVLYVERRRFAEAAEAERSGTPRPEGAPAAGVSPGPEFILNAVWSPVLGTGRLDLRMVDPASGGVVATHQVTTPADADATSLARSAVAGVLAVLDEMGRRPTWADPRGDVVDVAPTGYRPAGIPAAAAQAFFQGLAAEEQWEWEGARIGYQTALARGGSEFVEAAAALARVARLRNGGTLGGG